MGTTTLTLYGTHTQSSQTQNSLLSKQKQSMQSKDLFVLSSALFYLNFVRQDVLTVMVSVPVMWYQCPMVCSIKITLKSDFSGGAHTVK